MRVEEKERKRASPMFNMHFTNRTLMLNRKIAKHMRLTMSNELVGSRQKTCKGRSFLRSPSQNRKKAVALRINPRQLPAPPSFPNYARLSSSDSSDTGAGVLRSFLRFGRLCLELEILLAESSGISSLWQSSRPSSVSASLSHP